MKKSPFIYGNVVSTFAFTNRKKEREKLYSNLTDGINTMIISPRRWGKSSLAERVFKDISNKNNIIKTLIIDLFAVSNEEEFLELFAKEVIKASSSKLDDWVKNSKQFFQHLIPKISLGADPISDFSLSFNWDEIKKNRAEILNLPEVIARKKKISIIIGLDEFQNLSSFPDFKNIEKRMRAIWQRQKNVTYCIYGSKRHMMTNIFDNPSNPFYRFGDIIMLSKIEEKEWVTFIYKGFIKSGKQIEKSVAKFIPVLMKNHSWYVQQLSHYTWNLTVNIATQTEIKKALEELINANTPLYQQAVELLSRTQLNLLKAIINNETKFTSTTVMETYNLGTPHNVSKNKKILVEKDIINKNGERYELIDPAFEIWFRQQYFNRKLDSYFAT